MHVYYMAVFFFSYGLFHSVLSSVLCFLLRSFLLFKLTNPWFTWNSLLLFFSCLLICSVPFCLLSFCSSLLRVSFFCSTTKYKKNKQGRQWKVGKNSCLSPDFQDVTVSFFYFVLFHSVFCPFVLFWVPFFYSTTKNKTWGCKEPESLSCLNKQHSIFVKVAMFFLE